MRDNPATGEAARVLLMMLRRAIENLYETAVKQRARTSTLRLRPLAEYCAAELEARGLLGAEIEAPVPGGGRPKFWDVAWSHGGKYRAAISLKSILKNLSGTVPNRIDDMVGEVANAQMYSPEIVLGYLMVFDISKDRYSSRHGMTWCELLKGRLALLSGRSAPSWGFGTLEAYAVLEVDFSAGPRIITPESVVGEMFDRLVSEVKARNPSVG